MYSQKLRVEQFILSEVKRSEVHTSISTIDALRIVSRTCRAFSFISPHSPENCRTGSSSGFFHCVSVNSFTCWKHCFIANLSLVQHSTVGILAPPLWLSGNVLQEMVILVRRNSSGS